MASYSEIEWTESTWNPITGCTKVSPGCRNCYAERLSKRLMAMGQANYANGFNLTLHEELLTIPLKWKKPRAVFVNSMSDLFHEAVPLEFIVKVFEVMRKASQHTFQVLTKRSDRLLELAPRLTWSANVWLGVSVETSDYLFRIDHLRQTPARVKFISFEPLLGSIGELSIEGIDWVIVGGESGPKARPMNIEWVRQIRDYCLSAGVPFFFKQWGGSNKKAAGRVLDGRTWDEMPVETPSVLLQSFNLGGE
ncbi:MAG: phage Gp37/Gp68 family protein [Armatimonadetes bacterium]|nr:phage Gp37/Gp68 family protein [Armatimonadota bacterium]